ncbi:MAG TPA: type IV toxin-antitoxin system AbiEi family antitoxin, partial [Puia sp.]|nr:type IV toxin-antitoxin system AbiEi family antitoxin [Puia sp.]
EKMAKTMQEMQLNYLDTAGNTCIKTKEIFILIEGNKQNKIDIDKTAKAFSKTGLKVVFQFIHEQESINDTIRDIGDRTGVSLDTVHKTIQALRQMRYIIPVTKGKWIWNNRYELFEKWVNEYAAKLKPGLHVGNFRFVKEENFNKWKQLKLFRSTCWGGEPAGELLTNYLNPETLTIYTTEPKADLIKNYKMIADPNGHIRVYQKFWSDAIQEKNTAPMEIVYADLINTGNKRNIETAQKIYDQYLQDKF